MESGVPPLALHARAAGGGSECSTSFPSPHRAQPLRKCASTPTLQSAALAAGHGRLGAAGAGAAEAAGLGADGGGEGLEVYVVLRSFREFAGGIFQRLPAPLRDGVRDVGVCHFLVAFRDPRDGSLHQFDFGPAAGGDVHVGGRGPLARLLGKAPAGSGPAGRGQARRVRAAVRERTLRALPDARLYVGRTPLSLADVRAWSALHAAAHYELHRSDCRHYTDALVAYATGVRRAAAATLRAQWGLGGGVAVPAPPSALPPPRRRRGLGAAAARPLAALGHLVTDAAHWERVRAAGHAAAAAVLALAARAPLARAALALRPAAAAAARPALAPLARRGVVPLLAGRPAAAVGATAVATAAAGAAGAGQGSGGAGVGLAAPAAAAREAAAAAGARVAAGVGGAMRAAAAFAGAAGRRAGATAAASTSGAAAVVATAGRLASRGAALAVAARRGARRAAAPAPAPAGLRGSASAPALATLPSLRGKRAEAHRLAIVASAVARR